MLLPPAPVEAFPGVSLRNERRLHVCGHPQAQDPELPGCEPERAHRRCEL